MTDQKPGKGRVQFLLIAAVFLGQLALAAWLYFAGQDLTTVGRTHNGALLQPIENLVELPAVLVNPRVSVSTSAVFENLKAKSNLPMPADLWKSADVSAVAAWLSDQRNDLQEPAIAAAPAIRAVLSALSDTENSLLHRMSGSGATCFGIYPTRADAIAATEELRRKHPSWWIKATMLGDRSGLVAPRLS